MCRFISDRWVGVGVRLLPGRWMYKGVYVHRLLLWHTYSMLGSWHWWQVTENVTHVCRAVHGHVLQRVVWQVRHAPAVRLLPHLGPQLGVSQEGHPGRDQARRGWRHCPSGTLTLVFWYSDWRSPAPSFPLSTLLAPSLPTLCLCLIHPPPLCLPFVFFPSSLPSGLLMLTIVASVWAYLPGDLHLCFVLLLLV